MFFGLLVFLMFLLLLRAGATMFLTLLMLSMFLLFLMLFPTTRRWTI